MLEAVQQLEEPIIFGGPLQIEIIDEMSFDGQIPGAEEDRADFQRFIWTMLSDPPWEMPEGEVVFDQRTAWFHYYSAEWWVEPPPPTWAERYRLVPRKRGYWDYWAAEEAAEYLTVAWKRQFGNLGRTIPKPEPPAPAVVAPAIVAPPVKLSSRRRGLLQMAQEMEMDANVLEDQIESGAYNYVVSLLVECQSMVKTGEGYGTYAVRREYGFDKADAEHNVANRNVPGTVTIKKKEMGK